MRHKISGRKLNRKTSHRLAMLKNMTKSLLRNEQIETTLPKAKDLRPFIEKIITKGKKDNLHSRRKVFDSIRDKTLVEKVFSTLAKRYVNRNGGYVRILKSGFRYGDSAPMAVIELVDRENDAKGKLDKERIRNQELAKTKPESTTKLDQKIEESKDVSTTEKSKKPVKSDKNNNVEEKA